MMSSYCCRWNSRSACSVMFPLKPSGELCKIGFIGRADAVLTATTSVRRHKKVRKTSTHDDPPSTRRASLITLGRRQFRSALLRARGSVSTYGDRSDCRKALLLGSSNWRDGHRRQAVSDSPGATALPRMFTFTDSKRAPLTADSTCQSERTDRRVKISVRRVVVRTYLKSSGGPSALVPIWEHSLTSCSSIFFFATQTQWEDRLVVAPASPLPRTLGPSTDNFRPTLESQAKHQRPFAFGGP